MMIMPPKAQQLRAKAPLRALASTPAAARRAAPLALKALPPIVDMVEDAKVVVDEKPNVAQAGMAAAAAMGFNVLPKAPAQAPAAPALGLRPTVNTAAQAPYGASLVPGGRICIQYLCHARCDLGSNCPEAHIIDPEEEMRVRARFKDQECHFGAECTRHGCLFRHPGERLEDAQFQPEGQQMALRATAQGMQLSYM